MFDFAKTLVCGIGKMFVGTLAVLGGCWVTNIVLSDEYRKGEGELLHKTLTN